MCYRKKKKKESKAETILKFSLRLLPKRALATALCQTQMNARSRVFIQPQALRTCWVVITCCTDLHSLPTVCSVRQAREKDKLVLSFLCNHWSIIFIFPEAAALTSTLKVTII